MSHYNMVKSASDTIGLGTWAVNRLQSSRPLVGGSPVQSALTPLRPEVNRPVFHDDPYALQTGDVLGGISVSTASDFYASGDRLAKHLSSLRKYFSGFGL
jgi:hypothetical protein